MKIKASKKKRKAVPLFSFSFSLDLPCCFVVVPLIVSFTVDDSFFPALNSTTKQIEKRRKRRITKQVNSEESDTGRQTNLRKLT